MSSIVEKIDQMIQIANEICDEDQKIGEIFLANLGNSIQIIQAGLAQKPLDIDDKLELLCDLLQIDLEEIIVEIMNRKNAEMEDGDSDTVEFIINNTKDIEDYANFLEENSVKDNLAYLKEKL